MFLAIPFPFSPFLDAIFYALQGAYNNEILVLTSDHITTGLHNVGRTQQNFRRASQVITKSRLFCDFELVLTQSKIYSS